MPRLFGTAGIRGGYLDKVTPELAYRVGLALANYIGGGSVTVGHDVRTTSPLLAHMAAAGIMAGGSDAVYLGLAPTPVVAYSVPRSRSKAGIVITASHNPPPDNGIKVFDERGMEYTLKMEESLEELILDGDLLRRHAPWNQVGSLVESYDIIDDYVRSIVDKLSPSRRKRLDLKLGVDCANGAASLVTPRILKMIGVSRVVSFNCHPDGMFPGRHPEPRPDVLEPLTRAGEIMGLHAILAHDGDADRLALTLPHVGFIKQDLLIALFAMYKLMDKRGAVIVSVDVGREVEDIVERMGGTLVRAKLGKIHEKLKETPGAVLAAEPWKLIDPEWGPWVDGIYQAALIAMISIEEGETPLDLVVKLPFYPSARISVRFQSDQDKLRVYTRFAERVRGELTNRAVSVSEIDGIRIDYDDGSWLLVRASGTEPKVRIYAQSMDKDRLEEIVEKSLGILLEEAQKAGAPVIDVEKYVDLGFGLGRHNRAS